MRRWRTVITADPVWITWSSLGPLWLRIAREKAGIIKRGIPAICAEAVSPKVSAVIEISCRAPACHRWHAAGQGWHVGVERGRLVYQDDLGLMDLAAPKLVRRSRPGTNSTMQVSRLRRCARRNLFRIEPAAFEAGIVNAEWPARDCTRLATGSTAGAGAARLRDMA